MQDGNRVPVAIDPKNDFDRPLKSENPDLYYTNSHIESYNIC